MSIHLHLDNVAVMYTSGFKLQIVQTCGGEEITQPHSKNVFAIWGTSTVSVNGLVFLDMITSFQYLITINFLTYASYC